MKALCTYSIYLLTSDLSSFVISNTDKQCCDDVLNNVDCIIKRDVYPPKNHSCSKNICGISFCSKNIHGT